MNVVRLVQTLGHDAPHFKAKRKFMTNEKGPNLEPTLVLMRHAARDFSDDGLSQEGERQCARLGDVLANRGIGGPILLESSPKRRTRATLRPLGEAKGLKVEINSALDERGSNESSLNFESRVKKFCHDLDHWAQKLQQNLSQNLGQSAPKTRIACSHLDWLEMATQFLSSDDNDFERSEPWPAMSLRIYRFQEGIWRRMK